MNLATAERHEHRGITFYVGPRIPFPGLGWAIREYDHLGRPKGLRESSGAFYDDCEDHPEGARVWAEAACRALIDGVRSEEETR